MPNLLVAGLTWNSARGDDDLGIQQTGAVGSSPKERVTAVFGRHPPALVDLLARTDPRAITEHGYYTHELDKLQGVSCPNICSDY